MRSIYSIFAAKGFCKLVAGACFLCMGGLACAQEDNYSLWPRRPDTFAMARKLVSENKVDEAVKELEPLIREKGVIGREAREMVGEIRIKQVLSPELCQPEKYVVVRGDSWLRVVQRTKCPLDYLMHINQLSELGGLQVGQVILYKNLDYRVEVNLAEKEVFLWDGKAFIKSYPILMLKDVNHANLFTTVKSETSVYNHTAVTIHSPHFAAGDKSIQLANGGFVIDSTPDGRMNNPGIYLKREDCNELSLLLRPGNKVDIVKQ